MSKLGSVTGHITSINSDLNGIDVDNSSVWDGFNTRIEFWRVNWDSDFGDVVNWTPAKIRAFFDRDTDDKMVLGETEWRLTSTKVWNEGMGKYQGTLRVDLPIENLGSYNYVHIVKPNPPTPIHPIPNGADPEFEQFFFIREMNTLAPRTTEVQLVADMWTMYFPRFGINALTLTRGHYALANTNTSEFLANPLASPIDLTADEPDLPHIRPLRATTKLLSIWNTEPLVCIASTAHLDSNGFKEPRGGVDGVGSEWWNDYEEGMNGAVPVVAGEDSTSSNPPALVVSALTTTSFTSLVSALRAKAPWVMRSWKAVYVLPSSFLSLGETKTAFGVSFREVTKNSAVVKFGDFGVDAASFGYDATYADFAKMYTSQFAEVVITGPNGETRSVGVEELNGDLEAFARVSAAFPFLKVEAFMSGIGGSGFNSIAVRPWGSDSAETPKSSWEKTLTSLDIPTYSVFVDPRESALPFASIEAWARANARATALDVSTTSAETAKTNANLAASTARANATRSNSTAKTTNEDIADTNFADSTRALGVQKDVGIYTQDSTLSIAAFSASLEKELQLAAAALARETDVVSGKAAEITASLNEIILKKDQAVDWVSALNTPFSTGLQRGVDEMLTLAASAILPGSFLGATQIDVLKTNYRIEQAYANYRVNSSWDNIDTVTINVDYEGDNAPDDEWKFSGYSNFRVMSDKVLNYSQKRAVTVETNANAVNTKIRDRDRHVLNVNTDSSSTSLVVSRDLSKRGALRTFNTAEANATASLNAANTTAQNSYDLALANAQKTKAQAEKDWKSAWAGKIAGDPVEIGGFGGDGAHMASGTTGFTISINRISKASEKLVGNVFKLKGYRVPPTLVANPVLKQMSEWTYWEAQDVWSNSSSINDVQEGVLKSVFQNGVTLWENPENVKNVNIENNKEGTI